MEDQEQQNRPITFLVRPSLYEEIKAEAKSLGLSLADYMRLLLQSRTGISLQVEPRRVRGAASEPSKTTGIA